MEVGNVTRIGSLSRGTTLNDGVSSLFLRFCCFGELPWCVRVVFTWLRSAFLLRAAFGDFYRIVLPWLPLYDNLESEDPSFTLPLQSSSSLLTTPSAQTIFSPWSPLHLDPPLFPSPQTASRPGPTKPLTNHLIHDSFRPSSAAPSNPYRATPLPSTSFGSVVTTTTSATMLMESTSD
jgi:hypothetical protein